MAGASGDRNESLKETIQESLTAILSPDHVTRSNGEDQIKALEVTEGMLILLFCRHLGTNSSLCCSGLLMSVVPSPWHALSRFMHSGLSFRDVIFVCTIYLIDMCWLCHFEMIVGVAS